MNDVSVSFQIAMGPTRVAGRDRWARRFAVLAVCLGGCAPGRVSPDNHGQGAVVLESLAPQWAGASDPWYDGGGSRSFQGYTLYPGQNIVRVVAYVPGWDAEGNGSFSFDGSYPTEIISRLQAVVADAAGRKVDVILLDHAAWNPNSPLPREATEQPDVWDPSGERKRSLLFLVDSILCAVSGNLIFEPMNEGSVASYAFQEEIVGHIHAQGREALLSFGGVGDDDIDSDWGWQGASLIRGTAADALSVSYPYAADHPNGACWDPADTSWISDVHDYGKPVYLDTDHNCASHGLTAQQVDTIWNKGYNIIQLNAFDVDSDGMTALANRGGGG